MEPITATRTIGGIDISLETGKLAMQAHGSVVITLGQTQVLVTCTTSAPREGIDFFPLTVDVEERMYAAGKIPGGFFRREGRPSETAILTCRLIDRPLRPTFRKGFRQEVHVVCTILSADQANPYDVPSITGAGTAASLAGLPFDGPVAAVRVAYIGGRWKAFPTYQELDLSTFDMVVAGRRNETGTVDILMVEAEAPEGAVERIEDGEGAPTEEIVNEGLEEAKRILGELVDFQSEFVRQAGVTEGDFPVSLDYEDTIFEAVEGFARARIGQTLTIAGKQERNDALDALKQELIGHLTEQWGEEEYVLKAEQVKRAYKSLQQEIMRRRVVEEGIRIDGRGPEDIREITCEVGLVPRAHGSALFQRGETQVLNVTTLGMLRMTQMIDTIDPEESKRYMHHYNFPPFSTGETGFMRGPKRREIGHGALAERALLPMIPDENEFPYTLRLVSDVLSSNGSTSMASVCGSTLSLMDAGVPIKAAVAGIAMGLISEGGQYVTLTDILGAEDALGDMDFKVAGTKDYVTALQLDTKLTGLPAEVLAGALKQAREARLFILDKMLAAIPAPREALSATAPRVETIQIPVDKIGEVIGPKGKRINEIIAATGADIDIQDDGTVFIGSKEGEGAENAKQMIHDVLNPRMPEVGEKFEGTVVKTTAFGAFINLLPGKDGLLHISKLAKGRVENVEDVVKTGDKIEVVVREIDPAGKVSLERVWPEGEEGPGEGSTGSRPRPDRGERRDRGNGGERSRDRDRDSDRRRRRGSRRERPNE